MKKILFGILLQIALFSSSSAFADEFSGFRVGGGYSNTRLKVAVDDTTIYDDNYGKGFKIEAGYDINRIVGVNLSWESNEDSIDGTLANIVNDFDVERSTIKGSVDVGYAFFDKEAFLKPYAKLGYVSYSQDDTSDWGSASDKSGFAGIGIRFQYFHIYADLSADGFFFDGDDQDYARFVQTALTVGYKF